MLLVLLSCLQLYLLPHKLAWVLVVCASIVSQLVESWWWFFLLLVTTTSYLVALALYFVPLLVCLFLFRSIPLPLQIANRAKTFDNDDTDDDNMVRSLVIFAF